MEDQPNNPAPSIDGITSAAKPTELQPSIGLAPDNTVQAPANEPVIPPVDANVPAVGDSITPDSVPNPVTPILNQPNAATPPTAPKKKKPIMAIIVAVVVALGLGTATVFLYMKYSQSTSNSKINTTSQQANTVTPANTSDVDQTTKQLDSNLAQIDENKDFASTAISDQTLGL